jgi:tetratricopeptide (TPR) repeat protein
METVSATSLDAVREYARGLDLAATLNYREALEAFSKAATLDPGFGSAYVGMAFASINLDRREDTEKYVKQALNHLDKMTERERYRLRGFYYMVTNDYQACVKEYGDLIGRFSGDAPARNQRALCLTYLRDLGAAVKEMQQAVKVLPNQQIYRVNLALYSAYSSDFKAAEEQVQAMQDPGVFGWLAKAFALVGEGNVAAAADTYRDIGNVDEQGASYASAGLGDLAIYEGRYSEATPILTTGAAADTKAGDADRAASKFAALAYAHLQRGQNAAAIAAAEKALANSKTVKIRFLSARVFVEAGALARAGTLSAALGAELQAEPQAYALIVDGLTALKNGNSRQAVKEFTEANTLFDTWVGHYDLGRAYLEAGLFLQADSEFERCLKRRGEALALFLDEEPTYGYFPPVYYYQGLVRDGLKSAKAAESYNAYLSIRGKSTEDPLLPVVRNRAAAAAASVPTTTGK